MTGNMSESILYSYHVYELVVNIANYTLVPNYKHNDSNYTDIYIIIFVFKRIFVLVLNV